MALHDSIERKAWLLGRYLAKTLTNFSLDNVRSHLGISPGIETSIKLSSAGLACGNKRRSFGRVGSFSSDRVPFRFYDLSLVNDVHQDELRSVLVCIVRMADVREYNYEILAFRVPVPGDAARFEQLFRMLTFAENTQQSGTQQQQQQPQLQQQQQRQHQQHTALTNQKNADVGVERRDRLISSRDNIAPVDDRSAPPRGSSNARSSDAVTQHKPVAAQYSSSDDDRRQAAGAPPTAAPRRSLQAASRVTSQQQHRNGDVNNNNVIVSRSSSHRSAQRVAFRNNDNGFIDDELIYVRDVGTSTKSPLIAGRYDAEGNRLTVTAEPAVCELFCHRAKVFLNGSHSMAEVYCQASVIFSRDDDDEDDGGSVEMQAHRRSGGDSSSVGRDGQAYGTAERNTPRVADRSRRHKSLNLDSVVETEETDSRDELTTERSSDEGDYNIDEYLPYQDKSRTIVDTGTVRVTVEPPQDDDDDDIIDGPDNELTLDGRLELGSEINEPVYTVPVKHHLADTSNISTDSDRNKEQTGATRTASVRTTTASGQRAAEQQSGRHREKHSEQNKRESRTKQERRPSSDKSNFSFGSLFRKPSQSKKEQSKVIKERPTTTTSSVEPGTAVMKIEATSDTLRKKTVKIDPSSLHVVDESGNGSTMTSERSPAGMTHLTRKETKTGWDGRQSSMDSLSYPAEPLRIITARTHRDKRTPERSANSIDDVMSEDSRMDDVTIRSPSRHQMGTASIVLPDSARGRRAETGDYHQGFARVPRRGTYTATERVGPRNYRGAKTNSLDEGSYNGEWDNGPERVMYARAKPKNYLSDVDDPQPARMTLSGDDPRRIRIYSSDQERPKSRSTLMLNSYSSPRVRSEEEQLRTSEVIRDIEQKRKKLFSADQGRLPRGRAYTSEKDLRAIDRGYGDEYGRTNGLSIHPSEENYRGYRSTLLLDQEPPRAGRQQPQEDGSDSGKQKTPRSTLVEPDAPRAVFRRTKGSSSGYDSGEFPYDRAAGKGGGVNGSVWTRRVPSETGGRPQGGDTVIISPSRNYSISRGDNRKPGMWK